MLGTSPFEKSADLTLFDLIVGHPTSLPAAIGRITKAVRSSSDETLSIPFRHGILHGRSLGYANRIVCGKAWLLMIALVDRAADKQGEEVRMADDERRRSASWSDLSGSLRKSRADKEAIEAFVPQHWDGPFEGDFPSEEPPFAFWEFLTGWQSKNYGLMTKRAVNLTQQAHGRLAGRMHSDAEHVELAKFEILKVELPTVARAEARAHMRGQTLNGEVGGPFQILAFRGTLDGEVAMPADEGNWEVQQKCVFDLMHSRTADLQYGDDDQDDASASRRSL